VIDLDDINKETVLRDYMLANTPAYLYRHLRLQPSVEAIARSATPQELTKAISSLDTKHDRTAVDVAIAYAMLVALSFQNQSDVDQAIRDWHPRTLSWASHMLSIMKQKVTPMNITSLTGHNARIITAKETSGDTSVTFGRLT
jgi:hypothetical protein